MNLKDKDEKCFKWSVVISLHHNEIGQNPERISLLQHYGTHLFIKKLRKNFKKDGIWVIAETKDKLRSLSS